MSSNSNEQKQDYLSTKQRIRACDLIEAKRRGEKWAMLTSYDSTSARIFDHAGLPCVLIGDSSAQAVYGYKSTLPVTMDELIPLARAVSNSCKRALVIADLPFGSYQESPQQALRNSTRFMKEAQVHAVKLEGGADFAPHVELLTKAGVPVVAHIGFTPQSEHTLGGYKVQGRGQEQIDKLVSDALALEAAGAFACALELVPNQAALAVTKALKIPTIGIGAGPNCDAQILVWCDMVGFTAPKEAVGGSSNASNSNGENSKLELSRVPKFVKRYANVTDIIYKAVQEYVNDVKTGNYPGPEHCYE